MIPPFPAAVSPQLPLTVIFPLDLALLWDIYIGFLMARSHGAAYYALGLFVSDLTPPRQHHIGREPHSKLVKHNHTLLSGTHHLRTRVRATRIIIIFQRHRILTN